MRLLLRIMHVTKRMGIMEDGARNLRRRLRIRLLCPLREVGMGMGTGMEVHRRDITCRELEMVVRLLISRLLCLIGNVDNNTRRSSSNIDNDNNSDIDIGCLPWLNLQVLNIIRPRDVPFLPRHSASAKCISNDSCNITPNSTLSLIHSQFIFS